MFDMAITNNSHYLLFVSYFMGTGRRLINISYSSSLLAKSEVSHEDILNHAQSSLDMSISILNTVATLMGVLVALITVIVVIGGALGFFEYRRWQEFKQQAKESADKAKGYTDEAKGYVDKIKYHADETKKIKEEVGLIRKSMIKNSEEAINELREEAKHLPSLPEPFSEDQKRILDEYGKKIEFLEAFGVPLEPEDYINRGTEFYQRGEYDLALKPMIRR